jgi:release factor glutamine methyltransferase
MSRTREDDIVDRLRAAGCVFAEDEARLLLTEAGTTAELDAMVERRTAGEPLEHVLGWAEFRGLRIAVTGGVFVPRRRTELLVEEAVLLARPGVVVVDLCCGSGALGVAVATAVGDVELHAADVDPVAVACARGNVARVGGRAYAGDLFAALPTELRGRIDLLLANVPYVPSDAIALMPPEARLHEARIALDGGPDGLDVARRVIAEAPRWLAPGGSLLFEASEDQTALALDAVTAAGLRARVVTDDDRGATVVVGTSSAGSAPG